MDPYTRLARAVLDQTFQDIRIPKHCSRCGGFPQAKGMRARRRERLSALDFIRSERMEPWAHLALFDPGLVREEALKLRIRPEYICTATKLSRIPNCGRLE